MKNKVLLSLLGLTVIIAIVAIAQNKQEPTSSDGTESVAATMDDTSVAVEEGEAGAVSQPGSPAAGATAVPRATTPSKPATVAAPQSSSVVLFESDGGSIVTAATARFAKSGYVVIYRTNNNEKTELIGFSKLIQPGTYTNIPVQVTSPVVKNQVVTAVLHEDDGDGKFEFPASDFYLLNGSRLVYDEDVVGVPIVEEAGLINGTVEAHLEDAKSTYTGD